MDKKSLARPLSLFSALMSLVFAPSISSSSHTTIGTNTVCATGTCCIQPPALCNAGGSDHPGYFYQASGRCDGS